MAARIRRQHTEEIRQKIRTTQLVNLLQDLALTGLDAAGNEVTAMRMEAAKTLLRKTLPDLTAVEHSGEISTGDARTLTDEALAAIAASNGSAGIAETAGDSSESGDMVH